MCLFVAGTSCTQYTLYIITIWDIFFLFSFLHIFIFQICLGDSALVIEVERDYTVYGDELKFGGGKVIHICNYLQAHYYTLIIIRIV